MTWRITYIRWLDNHFDAKIRDFEFLIRDVIGQQQLDYYCLYMRRLGHFVVKVERI